MEAKRLEVQSSNPWYSLDRTGCWPCVFRNNLRIRNCFIYFAHGLGHLHKALCNLSSTRKCKRIS